MSDDKWKYLGPIIVCVIAEALFCYMFFAGK